MNIETCGADEARTNLPALLDKARTGTATVITRRGQPCAVLMPIECIPEPGRAPSILDLEGTGKGMWGADSRQTVRALRDEWDR